MEVVHHPFERALAGRDTLGAVAIERERDVSATIRNDQLQCREKSVHCFLPLAFFYL
jgi:hypothetical protein